MAQQERSETRDKLGGGSETVTTYSYSREWSASHNDSGAFRHPEGHANPPMAFARREFVAGDAKLGAFALPPDLLGKLGDGARTDVDPAALAGRAAPTPPEQVVDGILYVGANPAAPQVGDLKVSYFLTPNGPVSVIGRQTGGGLSPYQTKAGGTLYIIDPGERDAAQMFKQAESENAILTWIVRGGRAAGDVHWIRARPVAAFRARQRRSFPRLAGRRRSRADGARPDPGAGAADDRDRLVRRAPADGDRRRRGGPDRRVPRLAAEIAAPLRPRPGPAERALRSA